MHPDGSSSHAARWADDGRTRGSRGRRGGSWCRQTASSRRRQPGRGDRSIAGRTRRPKMPTEVQCPNPSCGRTSHLGEDPLGRIFRCPRCLDQASDRRGGRRDSGWTAVLGPCPRRSPGPGGRQMPAIASDRRLEATAIRSSRADPPHGRPRHELVPGRREPRERRILRRRLRFCGRSTPGIPGSAPASGLGGQRRGLHRAVRPWKRPRRTTRRDRSWARGAAWPGGHRSAAPSGQGPRGRCRSRDAGSIPDRGRAGRGTACHGLPRLRPAPGTRGGAQVAAPGGGVDARAAWSDSWARPVPWHGSVIPGSCRSTRPAGAATSITSRWH